MVLKLRQVKQGSNLAYQASALYIPDILDHSILQIYYNIFVIVNNTSVRMGTQHFTKI